MLPPHPVRPPASTRPLAQPPKQLAISFIRPFRSSLKNTPPRCSILIAALQLASPARPRQLHDTPRYPQISIARQGVAPFSLPLPRFRSLAVFVRRPGVRGTVREGPASENHLIRRPSDHAAGATGSPSTTDLITWIPARQQRAKSGLMHRSGPSPIRAIRSPRRSSARASNAAGISN